MLLVVQIYVATNLKFFKNYSESTRTRKRGAEVVRTRAQFVSDVFYGQPLRLKEIT